MRHRTALALLFAALPLTAGAQRITPSGVLRPATPVSAFRPPTRFIQRMNTYMNWGTVIGAGAGVLIGFATVPRSDTRDLEILWEGLIGASVGFIGGALVSSDVPRPLTMVYSGLVGWSAGMLVGGVTYAIRRGQD